MATNDIKNNLNEELVKIKDLNKKFVKKYYNKYFLSVPIVFGLCFFAYRIGYNRATRKMVDNILSKQTIAIIDSENYKGELFFK